MEIGERIKLIRLQKGMTQKDLSDKADISRVSVGNYERGDRVPNIDIMNRVANALDVTIDELTGLRPTFIQSYIQDLLEQGNTLESISKDTGIPIERIDTMFNHVGKLTGEELNLLFKLNGSDNEFPKEILDLLSDENKYVPALDNVKETISKKLNLKELTLKEESKSMDINWTAEELKAIKEYKEFLLSRRKKK